MQTLDENGWSAIWDVTAKSEVKKDVMYHANSVLGKKVRSYLTKIFGDLAGLKSIEIGCGSAIYSLILAQLGVNVTLLDYSKDALLTAERNLHVLNLDANLVQANAFNPPFASESHDIALSFGTVEHYKPPNRLEICKMHAHLVRVGGVVLIETPNAAFIPHEILKMLLQKSGKWAFGYEKGFSFREMRNTSKSLRLQNVEIVGSSFRNDLRHYYHIFRSSNSISRFLPPAKPVDSNLIQQKTSILDNRFARSIAILGVKSP